MIIECINCAKKFDVNSELIPSIGRTIQCGSCNHVWFFNKNDQILKKIQKPKTKIDKLAPEPQEISKNTRWYTNVYLNVYIIVISSLYCDRYIHAYFHYWF